MSSPRSGDPRPGEPGAGEPGTADPRPTGSRTATTTEKTPHRRPWWLWALLALIALAILLIALSQCGGPTTTPNTAPAPSAAPAPAGAGAGAPTDPSGPPPAAAGTGAGTGQDVLTADGTALLPLTSVAGPDGSLSSQIGKTATAHGELVQSVPADEGFWVGTSPTDRIWVQLSGSGESSYTVKQGDRVDFTGKITPQDTGFPTTVGVDAAEGADQLTKQGAHIEVAKQDLKQSVAS